MMRNTTSAFPAGIEPTLNFCSCAVRTYHHSNWRAFNGEPVSNLPRNCIFAVNAGVEPTGFEAETKTVNLAGKSWLVGALILYGHFIRLWPFLRSCEIVVRTRPRTIYR